MKLLVGIKVCYPEERIYSEVYNMTDDYDEQEDRKNVYMRIRNMAYAVKQCMSDSSSSWYNKYNTGYTDIISVTKLGVFKGKLNVTFTVYQELLNIDILAPEGYDAEGDGSVGDNRFPYLRNVVCGKLKGSDGAFKWRGIRSDDIHIVGIEEAGECGVRSDFDRYEGLHSWDPVKKTLDTVPVSNNQKHVSGMQKLLVGLTINKTNQKIVSVVIDMPDSYNPMDDAPNISNPFPELRRAIYADVQNISWTRNTGAFMDYDPKYTAIISISVLGHVDSEYGQYEVKLEGKQFPTGIDKAISRMSGI